MIWDGSDDSVVDGVDIFDQEFMRNSFSLYGNYQNGPDAIYFKKSACYGVFKYEVVKQVLQNKEVFSNKPFHQHDPILLGADGARHTQAKKVLFQHLGHLQPSVLDEPKTKVDPLLDKLVAEALGNCDTTINAVDHITDPYVSNLVLSGFGLLEQFPTIDVLSEEYPFEQKVSSIQELFKGTMINNLARYSVSTRSVSNDIQRVLADFEENLSFSKVDLEKFMKVFTQAEILTTASMIASCLYFMDQLQADRIHEDEYLESFVNEVLRIHSPSQFTMRFVEKDTVIGKVRLTAGSNIAVFIGAANRDSSVFSDSDEFRFNRAQRHIAFGLGKHKCIGEKAALHTAKNFIRAFYPFYCRFTFDKIFENNSSGHIFRIGKLNMSKTSTTD